MGRGALIATLFVGLVAHTLAEDNLQLRLAWGGGAERIWQGKISISQGDFSKLEPLGIEADEPGSIWTDREGIHVRQPSPRAYDGVDVVVTANLDATLVVSLSNEQDTTAKPIEIPLRSLLSQNSSTTLDDTGNRLLVSRSAKDRIRFECAREHLVFAPGETFKFEIAPHLIDSGGGSVKFQLQIAHSTGGHRVWSEEYETGGEGAATSISLKAPEEEGVYDMTIVAVQSSRLRARLLKKTPLSERKVQFVVLGSTPPAESPAAALARVVEINPVNPRWWERLAATNISLIPGMRKGPLGNGDAAEWVHPTLGPMIQLGPGGSGANTSWEAYPLPITSPGQPHVLEIEYPSDVPQSMGISLVEPNAAGAVMPIGLDSGLYVADEQATETPRMAKHRLVFWPRGKSPLLLITNRRQGSRAVYGKITVLAAAQPQFPVLALNRTDTGNVLPPAFTDGRHPERLWAGYLDRPLFVENFSAPEALDPSSQRSLDDWNTFYQGGDRLVKYLKHVGYSGLMLSAYCDGSTIYPSHLLEPTPRYDTGSFFATGQDPQRKDALELLLRLFEREHLTLIPALQFAAPLPELEALKRAGGAEVEGLEWIGPDGKPLLAGSKPRQGLAPYYNLLDPRVQQAMFKAVEEVCARYAAHEAFGGIALQLSGEGYAQLPGSEWGFDDQTISRFERATKQRVPGSGPQRFAARAKHLLTPGPAHDAWLQWRASVVADFHRRLHAHIVRAKPGAKLYLAGGAMLENQATQHRLRPMLPRRTRLEDALLELGFRAQSYVDPAGPVLLKPQYLRPNATDPSSLAAEAEIYQSLEIDRLFAQSRQPGSLFYHEPQRTRLTSFEAKSPFGSTNTYLWLVSHLSPSGDRNRRRFVHSLASGDTREMFDGGWLLPLGQEEALREILSVYRALPREPFETVAGKVQPLTIRTLTRDRSTYVYLVNDSPWEANATVSLELPADCRLEKVGESRGLGPIVRAAGESQWKLTLRPYDLVAARFTAPNVRIVGAQVTIPEEALRSLQRRIKDLVARVAVLSNPQPISVLENPGFEVATDGQQLAGWTVNAPSGGSATLDAQQKHTGAHSLKLQSSGAPVSIVSGPFNPPNTGRMAIEVWLRSTPAKTLPSLKIGVEGQLREGKFEPYGVIQAVGNNAASAGEWVRYSLPLDNLPEEGLSDLRIALELLGAGEVWIDDVKVFDLSFTEGERLELGKLITFASLHLEEQRYSDCAQLLEGYWPQFLVTHVPLAMAPAPVAERARTRQPAPQAKKPTVLENLRGYLPKWH